MKVKYSKMNWLGVSTMVSILLVTGCSSKNYTASVYTPYENSVVQINTTDTVKPYETGWTVKGGDIVTCYHGVKQDKTLQVRLYKDKNHTTSVSYNAKIVHADQLHDIAVLQLTNPPPSWPPTPIPVGKQVKKGENIRLLGYMVENQLRMNDGTVTKLHVKGIVNQRYVNSIQKNDGIISNGFRIDVVASAGNSGSPVFNKNGKAIGIFEGNANASSKDNFAISTKALSQWNLQAKQQ